MADEESEDISLHEAGDKNLVEWRHFALYTYNANRPFRNGCLEELASSSSNGKDKGTVSDFLQREATINNDFSLSIVATDLNAEDETELRTFIAKRLSRGTVYCGSSNVATTELLLDSSDSDLKAICYFQLLRQPCLDGTKTEQTDSYCSQEYVICFLSPPDGILDLYRAELENFAEGLLPLLDPNLTEIQTKVQCYLESWYDIAIKYVSRVVERLGKDTAILLNSVFLDGIVEIEDCSDSLKEDIKKFMSCCSMSDILCGQESPGNNSLADDGDQFVKVLNTDVIDDALKKGRHKVKLEFHEKGHNFDNTEACLFCQNYAEILAAKDFSDHSGLRQTLERCRFEVIGNLNTLKRLLRESENSYYALYRSYAFLKSSGMIKPLLRYAAEVENKDCHAVLSVLQEYLHETKEELS